MSILVAAGVMVFIVLVCVVVLATRSSTQVALQLKDSVPDQPPPQDGQTPPQDGQQPPQDGQQPSQDGQQPPQDGQQPPQDGQQPPQVAQQPPLPQVDQDVEIFKAVQNSVQQNIQPASQVIDVPRWEPGTSSWGLYIADGSSLTTVNGRLAASASSVKLSFESVGGGKHYLKHLSKYVQPDGTVGAKETAIPYTLEERTPRSIRLLHTESTGLGFDQDGVLQAVAEPISLIFTKDARTLMRTWLDPIDKAALLPNFPEGRYQFENLATIFNLFTTAPRTSEPWSEVWGIEKVDGKFILGMNGQYLADSMIQGSIDQAVRFDIELVDYIAGDYYITLRMGAKAFGARDGYYGWFENRFESTLIATPVVGEAEQGERDPLPNSDLTMVDIAEGDYRIQSTITPVGGVGLRDGQVVATNGATGGVFTLTKTTNGEYTLKLNGNSVNNRLRTDDDGAPLLVNFVDIGDGKYNIYIMGPGGLPLWLMVVPGKNWVRYFYSPDASPWPFKLTKL